MSFGSTVQPLPAAFNLNVFSHPPMKAMAPRAREAPAQLSDDEDIFNLDMVTMDMDFEQAYSTYTQLQQKNALLEVERLQRSQLRHSEANGYQGAHAYRPHSEPHITHAFSHAGPTHTHTGPTHTGTTHTLTNTGASHTGSPHTGNVHVAQVAGSAIPPKYTQFGSMPLSPSPSTLSQLPEYMVSPPGEYGMDAFDDMDQFFSNTELNALENFLDKLATSSQVNPLELYQHHSAAKLEGGKLDHMFDLHTMCDKPTQRAFSLPTPHTPETRTFPDVAPRRRRRSTKALLSSEQKRLNHLNLEQKRRLQCREAYDRCLRLITNVDDYKNDLVLACPLTLSRKKSKRRQLTDNGLPNLLKHTALLKITNEILKIKGKNERLQKLLDSN